jgi:hypothetical protein
MNLNTTTTTTNDNDDACHGNTNMYFAPCYVIAASRVCMFQVIVLHSLCQRVVLSSAHASVTLTKKLL